MSDHDGEGDSARWRRREQRRKSARSRIKKHGASLRRVYREAILKRLRDKKRR